MGSDRNPAIRLALVLSLCTAPLTFWGCRSAGQTPPLELKFGHVGAPGSLFSLSAQEFARRVNARLEGRARVLVFGSSQLGGDSVLLRKLKLGTVDLALPSTILSSSVEAFGLFELPYLVADRDHMKRIEEKIFWPILAPQAERKGYKILAVWENGFRQVTNNVHPIREPGDLRGIKLRIPRGRWRVRLFQIFGANPTPMALSEVFVALRTGVMDGEENPLTQIVSSRFHEVQRYLSLTNHVYTPAYVTVGAEKWASQPRDVREAVERAARETRDFVLATAKRLDRQLLLELRKSGISVNEVDRDRFLEASQAVYREFGEAVPGARELIDAALALN
ncbi:MAG: TRAP transporter substrate-binding protein [Acidobacteriota bacterium]